MPGRRRASIARACRRLPSAAASPDLRDDAAGRDQRRLLADETREERDSVSVSTFDCQEGAGIQHGADSRRQATQPS